VILEPALAELGADSRLHVCFDLYDAYSFYEMLRSTKSGEVDTWAIRWYWQTFSANKLTLYPRQSLVRQNGFDETAMHTKTALVDVQASLDKLLRGLHVIINSVEADSYKNTRCYRKRHAAIEL